MDEGFIKIEYEAISTLVAFHLGEVWRIWSWKRFIASDSCAANAVEWRKVGILLELLDFFAGFDYTVPHLRNTTIIQILQRPINHRIQRPQSSTCDHRTLQKPLIPHLENPLSRHISSSPCLLTLPYNALQNIYDLFIELSHIHLILFFWFVFLTSFALENILQLGRKVVLEKFIG